MEKLIENIVIKKAKLDALRPTKADALEAMRPYQDIELTYTSNAIEGNTLSLRETAEVIQHGLTTGGKQLKEHLEAVDHYDALVWMRSLAAGEDTIGENTICELHRRIVSRSDKHIAGIYSQYKRRIPGSNAIFPNPVKIPYLMEDFGKWLETAPPTPESAFQAHFKLTAIHPFEDGNGRTSRLLMNLLLVRGGYVPVSVRPADRKTYLAALETASVKDDFAPYQTFMHQRLDATLGECLSALKKVLPMAPSEPIRRPRTKPANKLNFS